MGVGAEPVQRRGGVDVGVLHDDADGLLDFAGPDRQCDVHLPGAGDVRVVEEQDGDGVGVSVDLVVVGRAQRARSGAVETEDADRPGCTAISMSLASGAEPSPTSSRTRRTTTNASVRTTMTDSLPHPSSLLTAVTLRWHPYAPAAPDQP